MCFAKRNRRKTAGDLALSNSGSRPGLRRDELRQKRMNRSKVCPVRAENLVRSCDLQSCPSWCLAMMIIGHVPAVHVPPDHAASRLAAARPA